MIVSSVMFITRTAQNLQSVSVCKLIYSQFILIDFSLFKYIPHLNQSLGSDVSLAVVFVPCVH